uniref:G_PROTEIN_RECEP_F1_2 domain-containing protein n=1 Tax=Rhabditophanes sp. KR3021 TaxID=114890 RepID=A0AC35U7E6_9BILA
MYLAVTFGPLTDVYVTASSWMLTAITAKRYLAVSKPFKERVRSKNNTKWICLGITFVAILVNIPRSLYEFKNTKCIDIYTGRGKMIDESQQKSAYITFVKVIVDFFFTCPFPPILSIFLTFKILYYRHNRLVRSMNNSNMESRKISIGDQLIDYMSIKKYSSAKSVRKGSNTNNIQERTKNDSFKSPLFLTLLNGKFFLCNAFHMVIMLLRWATVDTIHNPTMEMLREINIAAIILHSSTNWIMFSKFNSRSEGSNSVPDYQIFDVKEKKILISMWSHIDASIMGKDLLIQLLLENPLLIRSLIHSIQEDILYTRDELDVMERVIFVGSRIGFFFSSVMSTLNNVNMTKDDFVKIRAELRHVGMVHFVEKVKINSQDWFFIKRYLVRKMMKECECVIPSSKTTCAQSSSKIHHEQLLVANKFSSFLIHELKNGFVCETVRTSHANVSERMEGSCTTASGGYSSSTGNLNPVGTPIASTNICNSGSNNGGCTMGFNRSRAKLSTTSCTLPLTTTNTSRNGLNQFYRQSSSNSQHKHNLKNTQTKYMKTFVIGSGESLNLSSVNSSIDVDSSNSPLSSSDLSCPFKKKNSEQKLHASDTTSSDSVSDIDLTVIYV